MECNEDNLQWEPDQEFAEFARDRATRRLMRPDFLPARPVPLLIGAGAEHVAWVDSLSIPGWLPMQAINSAKSTTKTTTATKTAA